MTAAAKNRAQALRNLFRPPDPEHEDASPVGRRGVEGSQTKAQDLHGNGNALSRLRGLLPTIAIEARIALDVARDLYLTGGCEIEDGKRLRTAYERLKRIAEVVADAEREVAG